MRVAMISKACIVGIYQQKLETIAAAGVELLVLVPPSWRDERGEQFLERAYTDGYQLETLPIHFNGNFHLHFYRGLGARLRAFGPDILHIDEEPYNLSAWQALGQGLKVGSKNLFFSWQNINRAYPPPFSWGERWALKRADMLLVGTDDSGRVWREKGYQGPMRTIPQFGTDPLVFHPQREAAERPFTFGYIGRFVPEKGLDILLEALAVLEGDWRLRLTGSGPQEAELKQLAGRLGLGERIDWCDWLPSGQIASAYHQIDSLVLPSLTRPNWKEQFGRVLVEAMASGVPIVASDSGAIPTVVAEAGLIVPEGDVKALAFALQTLKDDPELRAQLRHLGRQRALDHFTHESVAQATVQAYADMLK